MSGDISTAGSPRAAGTAPRQRESHGSSQELYAMCEPDQTSGTAPRIALSEQGSRLLTTNRGERLPGKAQCHGICGEARQRTEPVARPLASAGMHPEPAATRKASRAHSALFPRRSNRPAIEPSHGPRPSHSPALSGSQSRLYGRRGHVRTLSSPATWPKLSEAPYLGDRSHARAAQRRGAFARSNTGPGRARRTCTATRGKSTTE